MKRQGTDRKRMRHRCEATVRALEIPSPFDVETFCELLSARRGRPIRLEPVNTPISPCGVWLAADSGDWIFYESGTSRPHQEHIILHEIGHLLCDHGSTSDMDENRNAQLFPGLAVGVVHRRMERSGYRSDQEEEAELLATLILERAGREAGEPRRAAPAEIATLLDRLEATLEQPGA